MFNIIKRENKEKLNDEYELTKSVKITDMHDSEPMLNWKDLKIVLDYITKLEQGCCEYKCICNEHQVNCILETLHYMEKENKRLNNIINEIYKKANDTTIISLDVRNFILGKLEKELKEVI